MESFFEGARLSETAGSRASSPSRSTILVRQSMCPPNPNIRDAPSFANSSPQRNPSRRHAYSTPTLNNTPTPSSDLSPQYSSLILSSNFSRSNISYFPSSPRVTSLWGSPAVLHRSLEQDYARPLGSAGGAWIPTGFQQPSPPTQTQIYPTGPSKGPKTGYGVGNPVTAGETGNNSPDTPSFSRILQQCVCGTEEGWGLETHNQFEGAEQVCYLSPLQDGEYLQLERCHLARGLDVQNRFKRCLPVCPIAQIRLEISPLQLGGGVLPVQNPPIRPHLTPVCVYQTPSPSCRAVQAGWSENPHLPGRLATIGIRPRFTERPKRVRLIDLAFTGISIESQEMYHGANSINRVSRLHNRLQEDDPVPAGSQGRQDTQGVSTHIEPLRGNRSPVIPHNWSHDVSSTCHSPSPATLQSPSAPKAGSPGTEGVPRLRFLCEAFIRSSRRSTVVDPLHHEISVSLAMLGRMVPLTLMHSRQQSSNTGKPQILPQSYLGNTTLTRVLTTARRGVKTLPHV